MPEALEIPEALNRREFLRLTGAALLALGVPVRWRGRLEPLADSQLGRVATQSADIFNSPSFSGSRVRTVPQDEVLQIETALVGDRYPEHNRVWYGIKGLGYVHSGAVQPVRNSPALPLTRIPWTGVLMEVCTPFVEARTEPRTSSPRIYRFYYETTHWVTRVLEDGRGETWYEVDDDKFEAVYFVKARNLRPIPLAELTPISPQVPPEEKRIEVSLGQQWIQCYEGTDVVFNTRVSTGNLLETGGSVTPEGEFMTFRKRSSRHMAVGTPETGYDLPGVPWVAYLTEDGVSFHGTYWHNDFGAPRSHGCINMTPQAAKWLYRWTHPVVPAHERQLWIDSGTRALIRI
jgi:hypothetical protein